MCFSATASFTAAAGLGAMGAVTLREAKTRSRVPIAALPLFFGLQQAVEGVIWLSAGVPWLHSAAAFAYVLFSHVLWPTYIPLAVGALEPPGRRRAALRVFLVIGVAISVWLFSYIIRGPVVAACGASGIIYTMTLPPIPYGLAAYVLVTVVSCLISSHKFIRVFGIASIGALAISLWAYLEAFYSVWCFFAAILSAIVYVHLRHGDAWSKLVTKAKQTEVALGKLIKRHAEDPRFAELRRRFAEIRLEADRRKIKFAEFLKKLTELYEETSAAEKEEVPDKGKGA